MPRKLKQTHESGGFSTRLEIVIREIGSPEDFSKIIGISATALRNYLRGERIPQIDVAKLIAQTCNVSPGWLILGEGPMVPRDDKGEHPGKPEEYIEIPYYDPEASVGNGPTPCHDNKLEIMRMPRIFMQKILNIAPKNAYIISSGSDSMEPTIRSGAHLILDTRPATRLEGVYALTISGDLYIKRLHMASEKVIISSDNKLYAPMEIPREKLIWGQSPPENTVSVLGKVAYIIQPCL